MTQPVVGPDSDQLDASHSTSRETPSTDRGRRTVARLQRAAVEVFDSCGFENTTMQLVASEADVALGTTYRYFADKEDLFRSLLEMVRKELADETTIPTDDAGRFVSDVAVRRYFDVYRRHRAVYRVWRELVGTDPEWAEEWQTMHRGFQNGIVRVIKSGQDRGLVATSLDRTVAAELIVDLFAHPAFTRIVLNWDGEITDDEAGELLRSVMNKGVAGAG